ncbi:MAG TPA: arylesterase [Thermoanaerobaculia bacterium]
MKHAPTLALLPILALLTACGQGARGAGEPGASRPAESPAAVGASGPLVAFLGDSLTAGLGLDEGQAYPALVGERLARSGEPIRVLNAGVSGDTTAGGLRRLPWLLSQHPAAIVVELGANDGLRGTPIEEIEGSLRQIVRRAQAAGARVLIVGMRIPPNYGPDYTGRFAAIYPRLARELDVPLVPFLLEGVGGDPALNQADGIHPTARGQELVADNVVPYLRRLLTRVP